MPAQTRPDPPPTDTPEPRSIQSVVVGFELIKVLETHPEAMTLKDLAAAAGMSSGKAHAYLASFRAVGLVKQEETGRYALGPYALSLGLAAMGRLDAREAAREPMLRLREATLCSVHLSVWSGEAPVIVSRLDGGSALPLSIRLGASLPLGTSATGRIFLTFLPEASRRLASLPDGGAMEPALVERIVEETRRRGLARTANLLNAGIVGLSAPVFDHEGKLAAALTVLGPNGSFDTEIEGATATALAAAAASVSEALGHRPR